MTVKRRRQRKCRGCHEKFYPDYRQKDRQYCCARPFCQSKRNSRNNRNWYLKNPDCLTYQQDLTRQWFLSHPDYRKRYRANHPKITLKNRQDTRRRMRGIRSRKLFEKTNSIYRIRQSVPGSGSCAKDRSAFRTGDVQPWTNRDGEKTSALNKDERRGASWMMSG